MSNPIAAARAALAAYDAGDDNNIDAEHLRAVLAILSDRDDDTARVLAEECAPDERHCSCVPILRREIATLREQKAERERAFVVATEFMQRKHDEEVAELRAAKLLTNCDTCRFDHLVGRQRLCANPTSEACEWMGEHTYCETPPFNPKPGATGCPGWAPKEN